MPFAAFLLEMIGPLAMRALISVGVGLVTFTGVTESLQALINAAVSNWSGVSAAVLQLATLGGIPDALGIIAGAMTSRVGIWVAVSATKFIARPS